MAYKLARSDFDTLLGPREEIWRYEALQNVSVGDLAEHVLWAPTQACLCAVGAKERLLRLSPGAGGVGTGLLMLCAHQAAYRAGCAPQRVR